MVAGCGMKFIKYSLFVFNAIFWLCGAALLAVGLWVRFDPSILAKIDIGEDLKNYLYTACYLLIVVGAIIFIIAFFGCCGAIRESICCLGIFIFFMVLLFGVSLAAIIFAAVNKDKLATLVGDGVKDTLQDSEDDRVRTSWNIVQYEFQCCGVNGYEDWEGSAALATSSDTVPKSCCVLTNDDPKNPQPRNNQECQNEAASKNPDTELWNKGCQNEIVDWMRSKGYILIAVCAVALLVMLLGIIFAVCLCRQIQDESG